LNRFSESGALARKDLESAPFTFFRNNSPNTLIIRTKILFLKKFSKNICLFEKAGLIFAAAKHKTTVLNSKHKLRK